MTIAEAREKCNELWGRVPESALVLAVLLLAASASFGLGYLAGESSGGGKQGVTIEVTPPPSQRAPAAQSGGAEAASQAQGAFVASKNGTKYYLPTCTGAARISEVNKVWFSSAAAAEGEGYTPAANCPGL